MNRVVPFEAIPVCLLGVGLLFSTLPITWEGMEGAIAITFTVVLSVLPVAIGVYLWETRATAINVPEVMPRRLRFLVAWLVAHSFAIAVGIFAPTNFIIYWIIFTTTMGTLMYARTRIPYFSTGVPWLLLIIMAVSSLMFFFVKDRDPFWAFVFFCGIAVGPLALLYRILEDIAKLFGVRPKPVALTRKVSPSISKSEIRRFSFSLMLLLFCGATLLVGLVLPPRLLPRSSLGFLLCLSIGVLGIVVSLSRLLTASRVKRLVWLWASSLVIALCIPIYNFFNFEDPIVRAPYNWLAWVFLGIAVTTVIRTKIVISYTLATAQARGRDEKGGGRRILQTSPPRWNHLAQMILTI